MPEIKNKKEENKYDYECVDGKCNFKMNKKIRSAEKKVDDLKEAIRELGYSVEDTEEGEIKII